MKSICHLEITGIDFMPRVWRAAISAKKQGYEVSIIGYGDSAERNGITYHGFNRHNSRLKNFLFLTRKMARAAINTKADIIQIHSPIFLIYAFWFKRRGKIVIFDSHENYPVQILGKKYIPRLLRKVVSKAYSAFEAYACRRLDAVLYPCTFNGKNIFEGRAKKSVKIENFSQFISAASCPRIAQAIYAGAITEGRGAINMAEAVVKADSKLLLCGSFADKELQTRILNYPSKNISFLGTQTRERLFQLYSSSAIGLCVLRREGQYAMCDNMSTKAYEYMQCGLPVILSDFPYAKAKNETYQFGICVDPTNVDEIANAIRYLLDNPEEARRMGENGRRAVEQEFNWSVEEKKLLKLYEELGG